MLFASVRSIPVAVLHYYGVGMIVIIGMWHLRSLSVFYLTIRYGCVVRFTFPLAIFGRVMSSLFCNKSHNLTILKITFRKYPAIHTTYIISHCTTLQYNHNI